MNDIADLANGAKATLDHIVALSQKIESLSDRQIDAEEAFLHRTWTLYLEGAWDLGHLRNLTETYCPAFFRRGWEERWEAAELPPVDKLLDLWVATLKHAATGPHGSWTNYDARHQDALPEWVSCTPSEDNPMPPRGQSVVYVLYDGFSTPCYVGSTGDFPARLKWHLKDGKPVVVWVAYPCEDRDAAYLLEDRLLKQHMPYLNKKRGA